jgi:tripartite-type tricarboxylate transporter receptor subunit TctC
LAPARTPKDIIARLNEAAARAIQAETFKKLALNEGSIMVAQSSEELDRYFRAEEEHCCKVIQDAGIKPE